MELSSRWGEGLRGMEAKGDRQLRIKKPAGTVTATLTGKQCMQMRRKNRTEQRERKHRQLQGGENTVSGGAQGTERRKWR